MRTKNNQPKTFRKIADKALSSSSVFIPNTIQYFRTHTDHKLLCNKESVRHSALVHTSDHKKVLNDFDEKIAEMHFFIPKVVMERRLKKNPCFEKILLPYISEIFINKGKFNTNSVKKLFNLQKY